MQDGDVRLELPPVEYCDDILQAFSDSGMAMAGGMGATPITWQELQAMNTAGGYYLGEWECRQVIKMSVAYCAMLQKGRENVPAPYQREMTEQEQYDLGLAQIKAMERMEAQNNALMKQKRL